MQFAPARWLKNVSIAHKLYFTVGLMALLIATELMILMFAINTLSAVRAYVGAEGLWSKAQKDAAYSLQKYGRTRHPKDYATYQNFLKVPLGDRKARLELLKAEPDLAVARQGFLEGRIHPDDIDGAIKLFRRFSNIYYINKAIGLWSKGDTVIGTMMDLGEQLHHAINVPSSSTQEINRILLQIDPVNDRLTQIEDEFSFTLGEGSRWLAGLILTLLFSIVLTVEICGLSITILVSHGIGKGLNEIIDSSEKIAAGDYSVRARAFSKDEIGILANSFNEMAAKLEQNINALKKSEEELGTAKSVAEKSASIKEDFLANMSHEIRTPMNATMGFTSLLAATKLNKQQQEFVKAIKISNENLMNIINDILDFSKIESGMIVLEQTPFSLYNTFDSLRILLHQKAVEKDLELLLDIDHRIPETLLGDPTRLMQVLLNLSDNAMKFTDEGSISIVAEVDSEDEHEIVIDFQVKDTGKGIAPDKLQSIFERFTQEAAETTRQYGGTGLGLSIAQSLVSLQKGSILVHSEPGRGSVFNFTIPFQKTSSPVEKLKEEPVAVSPDRPLKILVAEDNKLNQTLAVFVLHGFGYETEVAENGRIAVDLLRQKEFDLVLMDMQMPEMDGYEATRFIRTELKNDIPIIALTAHAMADEKEKCLNIGMNDYISKPFDAKVLQEKIYTLLG